MNRHAVVVFWSDEDDLFIAYAPDLPGCMAHGDTRLEAMESIEQAMELWIDVSREHGDPIPEPRPRQIEFVYAESRRRAG